MHKVRPRLADILIVSLENLCTTKDKHQTENKWMWTLDLSFQPIIIHHEVISNF